MIVRITLVALLQLALVPLAVPLQGVEAELIYQNLLRLTESYGTFPGTGVSGGTGGATGGGTGGGNGATGSGSGR